MNKEHKNAKYFDVKCSEQISSRWLRYEFAKETLEKEFTKSPFGDEDLVLITLSEKKRRGGFM